MLIISFESRKLRIKVLTTLDVKKGFYQMMELLQKRNEKIVMCDIGNFYVAIGKDAVLLNNINKIHLKY